MFSTTSLVALLAWQLCAPLTNAHVIRNAAAGCTKTSDCTFDYVIVGGGTAGLTLANRLSEDPSYTVAVIEAGGYYEKRTGNQSEIPGSDYNYNGKAAADTNPLVDWGFETTPQAGVNNAKVHYTRGKTLGGCTALNYMSYQCGTAGTFDKKWVEAIGDESWNYKGVTPYYRKSGNFTPPDMSKRFANATPSYDAASIGTDGPLDISYPNYGQAFSTWMKGAFKEVGVMPIDGFTSGVLNGSSWLINTIDPTDGHRESSQTAFLKPAMGRPNLMVYTSSLAEKIIFDKKVAKGVHVTRGDMSQNLYAKKEVILSAGAFQSPQLLMVSGVGPADTLKKHKIEVVQDLPGVGQDMNDHIFYGISYTVDVITTSALSYGNALQEAITEFDTNVTGLLTNPGGDWAAYEKLPQDLRKGLSQQAKDDLATFPADWPELEFFLIPGYAGNFSYPGKIAPLDGYQYATLSCGLVAPLSRGNVSISSASMKHQPLINPAWLTAKTDQEVAIACFKRLRQIWGTSYLQKGLVKSPEAYPGTYVQTDKEILEFVKTAFTTISHATSTCKMGKKTDKMAVLDSKARVYGMENLRVVDASAFPYLPPGVPQGTVYMVAEKIADDIKSAR